VISSPSSAKIKITIKKKRKKKGSTLLTPAQRINFYYMELWGHSRSMEKYLEGTPGQYTLVSWEHNYMFKLSCIFSFLSFLLEVVL
jgi:hypothetical protein